MKKDDIQAVIDWAESRIDIFDKKYSSDSKRAAFCKGAILYSMIAELRAIISGSSEDSISDQSSLSVLSDCQHKLVGLD